MTGRDRRKRNCEFHSTTSGTPSTKRPRRPPHVKEPVALDEDIGTQIHAIAKQNWTAPAHASSSEEPSCSPQKISLVSNIYRNYICSEAANRALSALIATNYFEAILWPAFCGWEDSQNDEIVSVPLHDIVNSILSVFMHCQRRNAELVERLLVHFDRDSQAFTTLCRSLFQAPTQSSSCQERCLRTYFLMHMFRQLDRSCVRDALGPFISMLLWVHLSHSSRQEQAEKFPVLRKKIQRITRRARKRNFQTTSLHEDGLFQLLRELECNMAVLARTPSESGLNTASALLALFAELLSHPRTRAVVLPLLADRSTLPLVQALTFGLAEELPSLSALGWEEWISKVDLFTCFMTFPHDLTTGDAMSRDALRDKQSKLLLNLQSTIHAISRRQQLPSDHPVSFIPLASQGTLRRTNMLHRAFVRCEDAILHEIRESLQLRDFNLLNQSDSATGTPNDSISKSSTRMLNIGALTYLCSANDDAFERFRNSSVMIQEGDLWTRGGDPSVFLGTRIPCLNTEFLNMQDYLLRNFSLYKAEAASVFRRNLEATIHQLQPYWNGEQYDFGGQSRFALPVDISQLTKGSFFHPDLPASMNIKCNFTINFSRCPSLIRREWEDLQSQGVMFLVKLGAPNKGKEHDETAHADDRLAGFLSKSKVRGILIESKKVHDSHTKSRESDERTFSGFLDTIQLGLDSQKAQDAGNNDLKDFHLIVRSPFQQDTIFPFLSTLRELLLNEEPCLPRWLEDVLVGRIISQDSETSTEVNDEDAADYVDTFLSEEHLKSSFPGAEVAIMRNEINPSAGRLLYQLRIWKTESSKRIEVERYALNTTASSRFQHDPGAAEQVGNTIEFDPIQVDAICSGMKQGVTLLEGPPGTGKTSCVAQMVTNLFHDAENERVLIVTRSDQALDNVVERILTRNVDPLRVLKLNATAAGFVDQSMSPGGRVNALLERRLQLLSEVARLAACVREGGDFVPLEDWNCELADNFYQTVVRAKWQVFTESTDQSWDQFPFKTFVSGQGKTRDDAGEVGLRGAAGQTHDPLISYSAIASLFADVEELRFLEVIRHERQRGSYVLTTYSRVVAMTGSYAASHRSELISDGFSYDTLIVEEATTFLEVESFLWMVLQKRAVYGQTDRLKRVVLVGDHMQVPLVQNEALRNICNLSQGMFRRLFRLGNKVIKLVQQGRFRKSISNLLRCQYSGLEDRNYISSEVEFLRANPGFAHTVQFIDTGDSTSEKEATADCFQNLVEAEFIAFVYIYMRLLGYPSKKIAVLTKYDCQVSLLQNTIESRLSQFPKVKGTCSVSTVDDFQGRVADYVLISFVRTASLGQATDSLEVTNAISRARLGVYMFGYFPRYDSSLDLQRLVKELPSSRRLTLVANETFADCDRSEKDAVQESLPMREVHSAADMAAIISYLYAAVTAGS